MASIIKFKKGPKSNLSTIFNLGEPHFTTDTNELFIGTGLSNINLAPIGENLLVNSNFQVCVEATDNTNLGNNSINQNTGRYIFGNFYLKNLSTSTGSIQYYKPTSSNNLLQLTCSNAIPSLSYYTKLPSTNFTPLENTILTLSFDSVSTSVIQYVAGVPNTTVSGQIPIGTNRNTISFTYKSTTLTGRSLASINFVLFQCTSLFTGSFSIGNFKVEQGSAATSYFANPIEEDIMMLKESYDVINECKRLCLINVSGGGGLYCYFDTKMYIFNTNPVPTLARWNLYNINGASITNYTPTVTYNPNSGNTDIVFSLINGNVLADGMADVKIILDNRP